jgi:hypothetical protein
LSFTHNREEEDDPEFWETLGGRRVPIKGADKGGDDAEIEARFADSMVLYKCDLMPTQLASASLATITITNLLGI